MTSVSIRQACAGLDRLIELAAESHEPIHIAGRRRAAVLASAEDWDAIQETMYLLSVPGMSRSIRKATAAPLDESARSLQW